MNTITTRTRIAGFAFSILMSTAVLGATVLSMQPGSISNSGQVLALERVTVTATGVN